MQYTAKIALLAVALFGTSALAAPLAEEAGYEVEAREFEVDNDLAVREIYDMYLEAREDPSLDARDIEILDLEAREIFEYLDAREPASATSSSTPPQTPLSPKTPQVETTKGKLATSRSAESKPTVYRTPHQLAVRKAKNRAATAFEDPKVYRNALKDKDSKYHSFAVQRFLSKPGHLKKALANTNSPYHKDAKRIRHQRKAKVYLSDRSNYKKALKHVKHRYHKDAVKKYFSKGDHFEKALNTKKSPYHKDAVREYLLDNKTRKSILADTNDPLYKQAKKMQTKINKKDHKVSSGSVTGGSTTTTTSNKA